MPIFRRGVLWEFIFLAAGISLVAQWRIPTNWTHLYPYKCGDLAACGQILDGAAIPNRIPITGDGIEVDRPELSRARAILAAQRLPKVSRDYRVPDPVRLEDPEARIADFRAMRTRRRRCLR